MSLASGLLWLLGHLPDDALRAASAARRADRLRQLPALLLDRHN